MPVTGTTELRLPLAPVPASRPKVSRWGGVYYTKSYAKFLKDLGALFQTLPFEYPLDREAPVGVGLTFVCPRLKTVVRPDPMGDLDNHMKGVLDAMTKSERFWTDDRLIMALWAVKRFAAEGEEPHIKLTLWKEQ